MAANFLSFIMQYVLDIFYYSVYNNGCRWNFVIIFHPQPTISPPFSLNLLYNKHIRVFYTKLTTHASSLANTRTLEMVDVQLAWLILRALYYYYKNNMRKTRTYPFLRNISFAFSRSSPSATTWSRVPTRDARRTNWMTSTAVYPLKLQKPQKLYAEPGTLCLSF